MTSPMDERTTTQIWAQTQLVLQRQLTRATYDTLIQGTRLLSLIKRTYCVQVPTPTSRDWLEHRLKPMIIKALAGVVGHDVELEFVLVPEPTPAVNPASASPSLLPELLTTPAAIPSIPSACARFAQEVDFQSLWFEKGRSSGYNAISTTLILPIGLHPRSTACGLWRGWSARPRSSPSAVARARAGSTNRPRRSPARRCLPVVAATNRPNGIKPPM
jgi:chromosomal replication initiation ATPase DnaA